LYYFKEEGAYIDKFYQQYLWRFGVIRGIFRRTVREEGKTEQNCVNG
jgi:hypothetical protein